jgi:preprotein translocase subunit SecA
MYKNKFSWKKITRQFKQKYVQFDIEPFQPALRQINEYNFNTLTDSQLQSISRDLLRLASNGVPLEQLLVKAYALAREAAHRILGMRPFDVQVLAGIAMHYGGLVEMQTGEGKTLAAVLPAYLNALTGKGVHVLTFNDYLAQRDAEWMGPVYQFLGLSVGFVREGMSITDRKMAYACDITYLTAKEAGFDYLKEFLVMNRNELVHRPFHFAIVDEADSILIDEARIPLVIAGRSYIEFPKPARMVDIVRQLEPQADYETDEYERNVFLTEKGISQVEKLLQCGNLFDDRNLPLLVAINNTLHAEVLLKRDVDYIVRNEKIELVDEFTGRVADKRHWPHGLQEAIEAKEGIVSESKGQILASVTLQNYIRLYPRICGMTGTAQTSAQELNEFYGVMVVVIPTNRPCIRMDYPDVIHTHKEAKDQAILKEIVTVHRTGRPLLIGTATVEESELLAERLKTAGVDCQVLNAKNDELEAHIIAQAGTWGAVTVSTNMAGRGTDIKLGGEQEEDRDRIVALGGLYVLGTNRHESQRVDNQLRGRSGRQGDPGESRFFISLEDELMKRYRLKELIPEILYPKPQKAPVDHKIIRREMARAQRIIEGQNFDIRRMLTKYWTVMEQQRRMIFQWRKDLLLDQAHPGLMPVVLRDRHERLLPEVGAEALVLAEKQVALYFLYRCWTDYLDYMSYVKETIYLVSMAGKVPVDEFNKTAISAFDKLKQDIEASIVLALERVEITREGANLEKEGLKAPSSTWTYLINDTPDQLGLNPICMNPIVMAYMWPLWLAAALYYRLFHKTKQVK